MFSYKANKNKYKAVCDRWCRKQPAEMPVALTMQGQPKQLSQTQNWQDLKVEISFLYSCSLYFPISWFLRALKLKSLYWE